MNARFLAYAQLLRLPNVFSAFADIIMAGLAVQRFDLSLTLLLVASSGCLYLAGMVFNDLFDRHDDAKVRAFRPIPSGRVSVKSAVVLGCGLVMAGILFAGLTRSFESLGISIALTVAIWLYDGWLKRTPVGPIGMGLCRFLNVLLGLTAGPIDFEFAMHLAAIVGVYIVGVTWFARTEEGMSRRWHLIGAAIVMLFAWLLALVFPMRLESVTPLYPYLLVGFGFAVGVPIVSAIRSPTPQRVQIAVKRCIFGLVLFDAVLATMFVGLLGLAIALLLLPAIWLGKRVYST